jgi:hypothetical protein
MTPKMRARAARRTRALLGEYLLRADLAERRKNKVEVVKTKTL